MKFGKFSVFGRTGPYKNWPDMAENVLSAGFAGFVNYSVYIQCQRQKYPYCPQSKYSELY